MGADERARPLRVRLARLPHGEGLPLPGVATSGAAAVDIPAAVPAGEPLVVPAGERALVPAGFVVEIPEGYEGQVRPRSGLALRHGIVVPNSPGTIDSDYRGEVRVILLNAGSEPFTIERGDRIAQLLVAPVLRVDWEEVAPAELSDTERGSGGFGHTGVTGTTAPGPGGGAAG